MDIEIPFLRLVLRGKTAEFSSPSSANSLAKRLEGHGVDRVVAMMFLDHLLVYSLVSGILGNGKSAD